MTVGLAYNENPSLRVSVALRSRYASVDAGRSKYQEFITARFRDLPTLRRAAYSAFMQSSDAPYVSVRAALWQSRVGSSAPYGPAIGGHPGMVNGLCDAFRDVLANRFAN